LRNVLIWHNRIKALALAKINVGNPEDASGGAALHVQDTPGHAYLIETKSLCHQRASSNRVLPRSRWAARQSQSSQL
jgi:hypothetical protein